MILVIGEKRYPGVTLDELSIRHTLALQRELIVSDVSSAKTWPDVRRLLNEYQALPPAERENYPEAVFLSAVTIWAARVSAGEDLTLMQAVDFPAKTRVAWIKEPSDMEASAAGKAKPRRSGAKKRTSGGDPRRTSAPKS